MPATALDVISLADAKAQLRVTVDDHDALITGHIEAAVDFVSLSVGIPLRDETAHTLTYLPFPLDQPMNFSGSPYVKSVSELIYWEPSQELREEPGGVVDVAGLGRLEARPPGGMWLLWPPVAGWPDILEGTGFNIALIQGVADVPPGLRTAVLLAVRQLYEGYSELRMTNAMFTFMWPHMRTGEAGDGRIV